MFGEIALIELILGGAIGTAMGQAPASFYYVVGVTKKDRLAGKWYHHFINRDANGAKFRIDEMNIKRGFRRTLKFSRKPQNHRGDEYNGYIIKESNFFITICQAKNDEELITQRYKSAPIYGRQTMVSLSLAQNYQGQASVNPTVLCREQLSETEFYNVVKDKIRVDASNRIMFIE